MKEFENFEEYYEVVIANVSHSILPDKLYNYAEQRIVEVVQRMYRYDIPFKKAAVLLETFFDQFVGMIVVPSNRTIDEDDFDYFNDNFNGAI